MTLRCPACDAIEVELVDDNGASFPETRVEHHECEVCGHTFREVLVA